MDAVGLALRVSVRMRVHLAAGCYVGSVDVLAGVLPPACTDVPRDVSDADAGTDALPGRRRGARDGRQERECRDERDEQADEAAACHLVALRDLILSFTGLSPAGSAGVFACSAASGFGGGRAAVSEGSPAVGGCAVGGGDCHRLPAILGGGGGGAADRVFEAW